MGRQRFEGEICRTGQHILTIYTSVGSKYASKIDYLLPEDSSIPMNAHHGFVPQEIHPHAEHGANGVEEGPSILHLSQLSTTRRVGVPVRDTITNICMEWSHQSAPGDNGLLTRAYRSGVFIEPRFPAAACFASHNTNGCPCTFRGLVGTNNSPVITAIVDMPNATKACIPQRPLPCFLSLSIAFCGSM